jgi:hypothetical protein
MIEENPARPPEPAPSVNLIAFGMSCAISSAILLLYAADYLFLRLRGMGDVVASVKVHVSLGVQLVYDYGIAVWGVVLICTVVSVDQACRNAGRKRTIILNFLVLIAAVGLAFMVRQAMWGPFTNLMQGIGTQR